MSEAFQIKDVLDVAIPNIVVMDVGARSEGEPRYQSLLQQRLATLVGFEPQPQEYERLVAAADETHRYFPYCLGRGGPATFHLTRFPGCSSIYEPDPEVIDLFSTIGAGSPGGNFFVRETAEVETVRLDSLQEVPTPDFVKIDVQGAELDVLAGGENKFAAALVIETEVEFVPLYKQQPLFGDVHAHLSGQGFFLHKLIDVAGRGLAPLKPSHSPYAPFSQMLWADAVFVRDFSALSRYSNDDLIKAAVVLHEAYRSIDLVAYLLAELGRRTGSNNRAAYLTRIQQCAQLPMKFLNVKTVP